MVLNLYNKSWFSYNRTQHRVQRTVCHAPFRGIFLLEDIFSFRELVLVATRR
jgi:hypothetical protein